MISLRTFSKIAGLAGLRIGYAIAQPEAIDRLNRVRAPYNVNRLAQVAAVAALEDQRPPRAHPRPDSRRAPPAGAALRRRGVHRAAVAGELPPRQGGRPRARVLRQALLEAGILVRDGAGVGFPGHLRIAIGTAAANARLLEVWDRTLSA